LNLSGDEDLERRTALPGTTEAHSGSVETTSVDNRLAGEAALTGDSARADSVRACRSPVDGRTATGADETMPAGAVEAYRGSVAGDVQVPMSAS